MRRLGIAIVAATAFAALAAPAAPSTGKRPRPTDAPASVSLVAPNDLQIYNDYTTPSRAFLARRAVIHYVVVGIDAPPVNDDDADGVPDYVERVGEAADSAITFFERRGFARIDADSGGPDSRPDVYISRFSPGTFGVAFPAVRAQGGAFVVVSNALDPSAERSLGSVFGTVAHELFHLVQFSYYGPDADPELPGWVLEGTAAAMERAVHPQLDDLVGRLQLRSWLAQPQRSLMRETYGSQLLWRYLDEREPKLLPAYLSRLAAGVAGPSAALAATYARVSGTPFTGAFGGFAAWLADDYAAQITPLRTLAVAGRTGGRVAPFAIHYLRLTRAVRSVTVSGSTAELVYRLDSEYAGQPAVTRRLTARRVNGSLSFAIPPGLRESPRLARAVLVIANGSPTRSAAYSVGVS